MKDMIELKVDIKDAYNDLMVVSEDPKKVKALIDAVGAYVNRW